MTCRKLKVISVDLLKELGSQLVSDLGPIKKVLDGDLAAALELIRKWWNRKERVFFSIRCATKNGFKTSMERRTSTLTLVLISFDGRG